MFVCMYVTYARSCTQGVQADEAPAGCTGRPHQDLRHRHHLPGLGQPGGDAVHPRLCPPRQEHPEQAGGQPETQQTGADWGRSFELFCFSF